MMKDKIVITVWFYAIIVLQQTLCKDMEIAPTEPNKAVKLFNSMILWSYENGGKELVPVLGSKLRTALGNVWLWFKDKGKHEDNFIGRCFGAARKLKIVIPLIVFKLGVIVTTLAFLTIFSLKSLGLLLLLILMNSTGWAAKLALSKHEPSAHKPQNVHLHVHQTKDGIYPTAHEHPYHGWSDRSRLNLDDSLVDLYDKKR